MQLAFRKASKGEVGFNLETLCHGGAHTTLLHVAVSGGTSACMGVGVRSVLRALAVPEAQHDITLFC